MSSRCSFGLCGLVLVVLVQLAVSLPPDFFRNGRGPISSQKRSEIDQHIIFSACQFCASFSSKMGENCRDNVGEGRRACLIAFGAEVDSALVKEEYK